MNAALIMFGIEAGVKLGQRIMDVPVDSRIERPILLPIGRLYADVTEVMALDFFTENEELRAEASLAISYRRAS
ncbi:MAG: hypothetical protein ACI8X5_003748 [Planctomycetota bacterium]|jgi:hypothetical protein